MASVARVLLMEGAQTASTDGTAKVLEASSENFIGWFRVTANDGATTVDAKIQHSADGTNWRDLVSFTQVVNTTSTEEKQIALNVLPYIRAVSTLAGTPSASVLVAFYYDKK